MEKKIALCLHGYYGTLSTNDFSTSKAGFAHLKEKILSVSKDVDVYVHCWQPEYEKEIIEIYNPTNYIFEKQRDFKQICIDNNIDQNYIDEYFARDRSIYTNATAERILSFYYSRAKSIELCLDKKYDCVITTRFDISSRGGEEVRNLIFKPEYPIQNIYTANWNQKNIGYADMWFYGSQEIMKRYSGIYDSALKDFSKNSEYEKCLTTFWPDSNYYNVYDFNDPRQFTNEIDREEKSRNLMIFPRWRVTDSHLHHKWYFMKECLYNITKWM